MNDADEMTFEISKWNEIFENADSRKRRSLDWFRCPTGCGSNGYLTLCEKGAAGMAALGVFQALCQLAATYPSARRGRFIHDDGRPLSIRRIAMLTRIDADVLEEALKLLMSKDVAWICQSSASHLPDDCQSSAENLPTEEKRREEKRREEKREEARGAREDSSSSPPPESSKSEEEIADTPVVDAGPKPYACGLTPTDLRRRINGWFHVPADTKWIGHHEEALAAAVNWEAETWDILEAFYAAPAPADPDDKNNGLNFRRQSAAKLMENLPAELTKAVAWFEKTKAARPALVRPLPTGPDLSEPPCGDWDEPGGLADEVFTDQRPRGVPWLALGDEVQRKLHAAWTAKNSGGVAVID